MSGRAPREPRQATLNDIVAQIDREEARTLRAVDLSRLDRSHRIQTLGKLIFFDRQLSVNRNEATGWRMGSAAAEQAERPPIDPSSKRPGARKPSHQLPADAVRACSAPGGPLEQMNAKSLEPNENPVVLRLSAVDRGRSHATYDQMAYAVAACRTITFTLRSKGRQPFPTTNEPGFSKDILGGRACPPKP